MDTEPIFRDVSLLQWPHIEPLFRKADFRLLKPFPTGTQSVYGTVEGFITLAYLCRCSAPTQEQAGTVHIASDQSARLQGQVRLRIGNHAEGARLLVLPEGVPGVDMTLGVDWLRRAKPAWIGKRNSLTIHYDGRSVPLRPTT